MPRSVRLILLALLSVLAGCSRGTSSRTETSPEPLVTHEQAPSAEPYLERKARFQTTLTAPGPSPQGWYDENPPDGITVVEYESDGKTLKAWLSVPDEANSQPRPALVYLHGGFAFAAEDFEVSQPFVDADYVVLCPMFRGENGNPGNYEMLLGEVDDAAAAIRWLADKPFVDRNRIYTFGHSSGGVISGVLSLFADVPIRHGGSSGGMYGTDLFDAAGDIVPFGSDPQERELRVLPGNIRWMKRPHFAFVGQEDVLIKGQAAQAEAAAVGAPLEVMELAGDHHSSLPEAVLRYLQITQRDEGVTLLPPTSTPR